MNARKKSACGLAIILSFLLMVETKRSKIPRLTPYVHQRPSLWINEDLMLVKEDYGSGYHPNNWNKDMEVLSRLRRQADSEIGSGIPPPFPPPPPLLDNLDDEDLLTGEGSGGDAEGSCKEGEFACLDQCISELLICDGVPDCSDGYDEIDCTSYSGDAEGSCKEGEFACFGGLCIEEFRICDGIQDCLDGYDEIECIPTESPAKCEEDDFICLDGSCISKYWRCDSVPDCRDASDETNCTMCPQEIRTLFDETWILNSTVIGKDVEIRCPGVPGFYGVWHCGISSVWDKTPDLSNCRSDQQLFLPPDMNNTSWAADNLTELAFNINGENLLPGDIVDIVQGLEFLQDQHSGRDVWEDDADKNNLTQKYLVALLNVSSILLEVEQSWQYIPEDKVKSSSTIIQKTIDDAMLIRAKTFTENVKQDYSSDEIELTLLNQSPDYFKNRYNRLYEHSFSKRTKLLLPENFIKNYTNHNETSSNTRLFVGFKSFKQLYCLTNPLQCSSKNAIDDNDDDDNENDDDDDVDDDDIDRSEHVNSEIIGATIGFGNQWNAEPNEFVEVNFSHIYSGFIYKLENAVCKWWDTETNSWSSSGCELVSTSETLTTCHCNHLTNLAVIMDIRGLLSRDTMLWKALEWITITGCSLSIIFLAIGILCFLLLKAVRDKNKSSVGSMRFLIRLHLCICLFIAELILLLGLNATDNWITCAVVTALLQFFFLATFTWSAAEAFNLYLNLKKVFESQISQKHYLLFGYGLPLLLVAASLAATQADGYGSSHVCWLAPNGVLIWSFAGTLALIMLTNTGAFVMAMQIVWKGRTIGSGANDSGKPKLRKLIGSFSIFLVLGLTWVTGFFFFTKGSAPLAVLFTVLNSLQGMFIIFFGIILDTKTRKELLGIIHNMIESIQGSPIFSTVDSSRIESDSRGAKDAKKGQGKEKDPSENQELLSGKQENSSEKAGPSSEKQERPSEIQELLSGKHENSSEKTEPSSERQERPSATQEQPSEIQELLSGKHENSSEKSEPSSVKQERPSATQERPSEIQEQSPEKDEQSSEK